MSGRRPLVAKITLAIFLAGAAGMILNEGRLEMNRPTAADPVTGYTIPVNYRLSGKGHTMYVTRQDQAVRDLLVVAIAASLLTHAWAAGLASRRR